MPSGDELYLRSLNRKMEDWQLDFEWLRIQHFVKERMNQAQLPDIQIILLLVGIQEANVIKESYTKEEKQDLLHVATCHLLGEEGYFEFVGFDDQKWPHYKQVRMIPVEGEKAQERLLKECIIKYFAPIIKSNTVVHDN